MRHNGAWKGPEKWWLLSREAAEEFRRGGAEAAARALGEDFLGRIPLAMEIRVASDAGQPPAANDGQYGEPFAQIAARLADWLDRR